MIWSRVWAVSETAHSKTQLFFRKRSFTKRAKRAGHEYRKRSNTDTNLAERMNSTEPVEATDQIDNILHTSGGDGNRKKK